MFRFKVWDTSELLEGRKDIEAACEALENLDEQWFISEDAKDVLEDLRGAIRRLQEFDRKTERERLEAWRSAAQAAA